MKFTSLLVVHGPTYFSAREAVAISLEAVKRQIKLRIRVIDQC